MSFQSKYTELFTIQMFHDYFLDVGLEKFSDMSNEDREKELAQFNWSSYLDIQPTKDTIKKLANQRMRLFRDNTSFKVVLSVDGSDLEQPFIPISPDLQLDFLVRFSDEQFSEYSDIPINSKQLFWLTNKEQSLVPLIPLLGDAGDLTSVINDAFVLDEQTTKNFRKWHQVAPRETLVGIISIKMEVEDEAYSVTYEDDGVQKIKGTHYYTRFGNSQYYWRYQRKDIQANYVTPEKYPLVRKGFIDIDPEDLIPPIPSSYIVSGMKLPNPQVGLIEKVAEEVYSVIYI